MSDTFDHCLDAYEQHFDYGWEWYGETHMSRRRRYKPHTQLYEEDFNPQYIRNQHHTKQTFGKIIEQTPLAFCFEHPTENKACWVPKKYCKDKAVFANNTVTYYVWNGFEIKWFRNRL